MTEFIKPSIAAEWAKYLQLIPKEHRHRERRALIALRNAFYCGAASFHNCMATVETQAEGEKLLQSVYAEIERYMETMINDTGEDA